MLLRKIQHSHQKSIEFVDRIKWDEVLESFLVSDTFSRIFLHLLNCLHFVSIICPCSRSHFFKLFLVNVIMKVTGLFKSIFFLGCSEATSTQPSSVNFFCG